MNTVKEILRPLTENKIEYCIIGGLAVKYKYLVSRNLSDDFWTIKK